MSLRWDIPLGWKEGDYAGDEINPGKMKRKACEACRAVKQRCEGGEPCAWCIQQKLPCRRLERRSWGSIHEGGCDQRVKKIEVADNIVDDNSIADIMPPDVLIEACAMAASFHFECLGAEEYYFMDGSALIAMAVIAQEILYK